MTSKSPKTKPAQKSITEPGKKRTFASKIRVTGTVANKHFAAKPTTKTPA